MARLIQPIGTYSLYKCTFDSTHSLHDFPHTCDDSALVCVFTPRVPPRGRCRCLLKVGGASPFVRRVCLPVSHFCPTPLGKSTYCRAGWRCSCRFLPRHPLSTLRPPPHPPEVPLPFLLASFFLFFPYKDLLVSFLSSVTRLGSSLRLLFFCLVLRILSSRPCHALSCTTVPQQRMYAQGVPWSLLSISQPLLSRCMPTHSTNGVSV